MGQGLAVLLKRLCLMVALLPQLAQAAEARGSDPATAVVAASAGSFVPVLAADLAFYYPSADQPTARGLRDQRPSGHASASALAAEAQANGPAVPVAASSAGVSTPVLAADLAFSYPPADQPSVRGFRKEMPRLPESTAAFDVGGLIAVTSDYRARGLSVSEGKPALQGELTLEHRSGLFASAFLSTVRGVGGPNLELALTAGYGRDVGAFHLEGGFAETLNPGVSGTSFYEIYGAMTRQIGSAELGLSLSYAPKQANLGNLSNLYASALVEVPLGDLPIVVSGAFGYENGAFGNHKLDWYLGANMDLKFAELGLGYIDATRTEGAPWSGATVVASLSRGF